MKNTFKVKAVRRIAGNLNRARSASNRRFAVPLLIIAIVAIIGFSMLACSDNSGSNTGGNTGGNDGGNTNKFAGTSWRGDMGSAGSFDATTWTATTYGFPSYRGNYTVSNKTITFTVTWADPDFTAMFNFRSGDILTATIINDNTFRDDRWGETFTKVR
jgi:hypothetical protein